MSKGQKSILVVAPLVRDVIYVKQHNKIYLYDERAGGSCWNALANSAFIGGNKCYSAYVAGNDSVALNIISENNNLDIKVLHGHLTKGRYTRSLNQILNITPHKSPTPTHKFKSKCFICGQDTYIKETSRISPRFLSTLKLILEKKHLTPTIIHTDAVDKTRFNFYESMRKKGSVLSLDLGRSAGLFRLKQAPNIRKRFELVDILFLHENLEQEFLEMLSLDSLEDIFNELNLHLLVVHRGEKGISVIAKNSKQRPIWKDMTAYTKKSIMDTSGAGDSLIGYTLTGLLHNGKETASSFHMPNYKTQLKILDEAQKYTLNTLSFIGARGHIYHTPDDIDNIHKINNIVKKKEKDIILLKHKNFEKRLCIACKRPINFDRQMTVNMTTFENNLLKIPNIIRVGWKKRNNTPWLELHKIKGPGYVIGTGGSYSVAYYISLILSKLSGNIFQPIRPFDYIRLGLKTQTVVFISNSGKTPDIKSAISKALKLNVNKIILISGAEQPQIQKILRKKDLFLCTNSGGRERGFLSVSGSIIPCFYSLMINNKKKWNDDEAWEIYKQINDEANEMVTNVFESTFEKLKKYENRKFVAIGGGYAWPAMLNFESKIIEGNFGYIEISELKDYSHGRFVSSIERSNNMVIFGMPDDEPYREYFTKRISKKVNPIIFYTNRDKGEGGLSLLLMADYFLLKYGMEIQYDFSKPRRIPRNGLELYRYKDILTFNSSE